VPGALPAAKTTPGDRGYDADWFRNAPIADGIAPFIPSKASRKIAIPHDRCFPRPVRQTQTSFD